MTAVFFGEPRAPPAPIPITLPLGRRSPANGGAEAPTARGGWGASIAQMYICALAGAKPLSPMPPPGGKSAVNGPQKGA